MKKKFYSKLPMSITLIWAFTTNVVVAVPVYVINLANQEELMCTFLENFDAVLASGNYNERTVTTSNGSYLLTGVSTMDANDRYNGTRSIRLRGNTTDNHHITMTSDKENGIGNVSFFYGSYGTHSGGRLVLYYSVDHGTTWIVTDSVTAPSWVNGGSTLQQANFEVNVSGEVRIKIVKRGMSGNTNVNIDDICITDYADLSEIVATPKFTPASGVYTSSQNIMINCSTENATIHYTTDGSIPTISSSVYTAPIPIAVTTTVKALAIKAGMNNSQIAEAVYTIHNTPHISINPVVYDFGAKVINQVYTKEFTVETANLTSDLTISITGEGFSVNVSNIPQTTTLTTVVVTFNPVSIQSYSGILNITGGSITNQEVTLSGTGVIKAWEDFEEITGSGSYGGSNVTFNTGLWRVVGYTSMNANDRHNGERSVRLRGNPHDSCHLTMLFDKPNGLGRLTFKYGSYANHTGGQLSVYYSSDQGENWILIDNLTAPSWEEGEEVLQTAEFEVNIPGNIRIKIAREGGFSSTTTVNIDDIDISDYIENQIVATPSFSPNGGTFSESVTVTISCETEDATIHYTMDDNSPNAQSEIYTESITLTATTTLKAIAFKENMGGSTVATAVFEKLGSGICCDISEQMRIYPVPAHNVLMIESDNFNPTKIEIFSYSGKCLYVHNNPEKKEIVNIQHLSAGIYFIRISSDKEIVIEKFVKQ